jgi:acyl-CoA synthetase (AMP-forming)/AMP-acid ligase II
MIAPCAHSGALLTPSPHASCIDELPAVATSAVVAVPDERMGETVGVFIQLESSSASESEQPTPASVRAHVSARSSSCTAQ